MTRWLAMIFACCAIARADLPRIAIDGTQFVRADNHEVFHPWGFNYDHNGNSQLIEEYWTDKWSDIEGDFREMKKLGANIVRIHLQYAAFMDSVDQPNEANLAQLGKLCDLANDTGLYLDLTGLACYRKEKVPAWFDSLDQDHRWAAQAKFWAVIAKACANKPAVFDYDLINEPAVPSDDRKQWLDGHFGDFWFCQVITLHGNGADRNKLASDWTKQMSTAIREYDKTRFITIGMLPMAPAFPLNAVAPQLDYVSVHIYPGKGDVNGALKTLDSFKVGKPIIIEETFPLSCGKEEEKEFILKSRPAAAGVIGFYWGKPPEELKKSKTIGDAFTLDWLEIFQEIDPNK